jgi:hypothetical protein
MGKLWPLYPGPLLHPPQTILRWSTRNGVKRFGTNPWRVQGSSHVYDCLQRPGPFGTLGWCLDAKVHPGLQVNEYSAPVLWQVLLNSVPS